MAGLSADFSQKQLVGITIHTVKMTFSSPIRLNVIWKRKNRRVETGSKVLIPAGSGVIEVNQTLTMSEALPMNSTGGFVEKNAELFFQALVDRGAKVVGKVVIRVGGERQDNVELPIEGCPDLTATVVLSVNSRSEADSAFDEEPHPSGRANALALRRVKLRASPKAVLHPPDSKDWANEEIPRSERLKLTELSERVEDLEKENADLTAANIDLKKKARAAADEQRKRGDEWEAKVQ